MGAGAGIFLDGGKTYLSNCKIIDNANSYTSIGGGGLYIYGGYTYIFNCEISNNSSTQCGGGIVASNSDLTIITAQ